LQKGAGGGPTGLSDTMQARASELLEHHASPMPLSQERHHKHTRHHKSHSRGAGWGAARLLGAGHTVPECTVCPAATTGRVPVKCAVQPSMPYALITRFYINPTVSETAELLATFGLPHLVLAHGLNRHYSTKQLPLMRMRVRVRAGIMVIEIKWCG